jgi:hypothetical protein
VGAAGRALHLDGESWSVEETGSAARLEAVLVDGSVVFAAGEGGTILRRSPAGDWAEEQSGVVRDIFDLAYRGTEGVLAVGGQGLVLERGPEGWGSLDSGVGTDLLGAVEDRSGAVTVVGRGGVVVRDQGAGFVREPSGVDRDLLGVTLDGDSLVAVGQGGTVVTRWADGSWRASRDPDGLDLHAVAAAPGRDPVAVGFSATFPDFAVHGVPPEDVGVPEIAGQQGEGPLSVRWQGSGQGYVDLLLLTESEDGSSPDNRLRCMVRDDGCHRITRDAVDWLLSGSGRRVTVRVERHEMVLETLDVQAAVVLDMVRAASLAATF